MLTWLSANLINIVLVAAIVLITGLLIRVMVRDKKTGKSSCGGNCASYGACAACGRYGCCGTVNNSVKTKSTVSAAGRAHL